MVTVCPAFTAAAVVVVVESDVVLAVVVELHATIVNGTESAATASPTREIHGFAIKVFSSVSAGGTPV
jgi:hypothetical protein